MLYPLRDFLTLSVYLELGLRGELKSLKKKWVLISYSPFQIFQAAVSSITHQKIKSETSFCGHVDSSVDLFKFKLYVSFIPEVYMPYQWTVQVSFARVLESGFVTLLHLCVSQIYPSVFALLEPRRKLLYNHLWRGVIHPEPQRVWPTQFLRKNCCSFGGGGRALPNFFVTFS